jgi:ubiquinone/menaquinone biosynthesis C-methylase UbiE
MKEAMMGDLDRLQHPRFARSYLRLSAEYDARGGREHRRRLLAGLTGRVIEVGAGDGGNFAHYPSTVAEVVAVEPDHILRASAGATAATVQVPVKVVAGHAGALPADDHSFDAAVVSLVLCSVPGEHVALAEIARVLRPGGELRFYEHVRSANRVLGWLQDVISPVWALGGAGCHLNRDTAGAIRAAGFVIDDIDRFSFKFSSGLPGSAHIIGRAHYG